MEKYREFCAEFLSRGDEVHVLFDSLWEGAHPRDWECLWVLDASSISEEHSPRLREWQDQGLAVGIL